MRFLSWDGCVNVRDLGGLPLASGGSTRFGAVVRSDNIGRLTEDGWRALHGYGVRTAIDLRFDGERAEDSRPRRVEVVPISLFGELDSDDIRRVDILIRTAADSAAATTRNYVDTLATRSDQVVRAVEAVAEALATGAVVVHCAVGKDRTGIVAALLLQLAGVGDDDIADDYGISGLNVGPLVDPWIEAATDDAEREFRRRLSAAPRTAMIETLEVLAGEYGGAEEYLTRAGAQPHRLATIRSRLGDRG